MRRAGTFRIQNCSFFVSAVAWLARRTRCPERAADLAQDTFSRIWSGQRELPTDARNYLATVARRIMIDDIRRRDVERAYLAAFALVHDCTDRLDPERHVEGIRLLTMLTRLLDELPPKVRHAFIRVRLDGEAFAVVAEEVDLSVSMTKRYVARAYAHCYSLIYSD